MLILNYNNYVICVVKGDWAGYDTLLTEHFVHANCVKLEEFSLLVPAFLNSVFAATLP